MKKLSPLLLFAFLGLAAYVYFDDLRDTERKNREAAQETAQETDTEQPRQPSQDRPTLEIGSEDGSTAETPAIDLPVIDGPRINEKHIFDGEINRRGRPVGYHSRPGGRDPPGARVDRVSAGPNRLGVYEARVGIRDRNGRWLEKRSTFFPDSLSRSEVLNAIHSAYAQRTSSEGARWRGPSGLGFTIEGYLLRDGTINTAYPLYRR